MASGGSHLLSPDLIRDIYGPAHGPRVLSEIAALQPRTVELENHEVFTTVLLPIRHHGQVFNIPLKVVFPLGFPNLPPRLYVTPRADMKIADRHQYVDSRGTIYHPYLSSWRQTSSVAQLFSILGPLFGAQPPLFSIAAPRPPTASISSHTPAVSHPPITPPTPSVVVKSNREKVVEILRERLGLLREIYSAELQEDIRIREVLDRDRQKLSTGFNQLQEASDRLDGHMILLTQALSQQISYDHINSISIDEVVVPDTFTNAKLLQCVASDSAHSDLIYQLEKALMQSLIPIDSWTKLVRQVARDQFFEKALSLKISRQSASSSTAT